MVTKAKTEKIESMRKIKNAYTEAKGKGKIKEYVIMIKECVIMNKQSFKEQCTCGDYKPYEPEGITAMLLPWGACMNCYQENMTKRMREVCDKSYNSKCTIMSMGMSQRIHTVGTLLKRRQQLLEGMNHTGEGGSDSKNMLSLDSQERERLYQGSWNLSRMKDAVEAPSVVIPNGLGPEGIREFLLKAAEDLES